MMTLFTFLISVVSILTINLPLSSDQVPAASNAGLSPWVPEYVSLIQKIDQEWAAGGIILTHVDHAGESIALACSTEDCDTASEGKCNCRTIASTDLCQAGLWIRRNCSQTPPCTDQGEQFGARCWGPCPVPYNTNRYSPLGVLTCVSNAFQPVKECESIPGNVVEIYGCKSIRNLSCVYVILRI
jgi:hypothetical protein